MASSQNKIKPNQSQNPYPRVDTPGHGLPMFFSHSSLGFGFPHLATSGMLWECVHQLASHTYLLLLWIWVVEDNRCIVLPPQVTEDSVILRAKRQGLM